MCSKGGFKKDPPKPHGGCTAFGSVFFWEKSWHWDGENGLDFVWVICYLFVKPYPPTCCFRTLMSSRLKTSNVVSAFSSAQNMRKKHQPLMEKWKRFLEAIFVADEFFVGGSISSTFLLLDIFMFFSVGCFLLRCLYNWICFFGWFFLTDSTPKEFITMKNPPFGRIRWCSGHFLSIHIRQVVAIPKWSCWLMETPKEKRVVSNSIPKSLTTNLSTKKKLEGFQRNDFC